MLYKFEHGHKTTEATKSIHSVKDESTVDHINQMAQEISLGLQEPQ